MIRQQRELLKQTFTTRELQPVSAERMEQLADQQQNILTATEEFATALYATAGPIPSLDQAIVEMHAATDSLRSEALDRGMTMEEAALASLIQTRENLRQILKMSNSSQASECRQMDQQQRQKLRPPQQDNKPQDQPSQQLSQACSQLEQLAEQQQQWSQQVCPNPQSSSSSANGSSRSPTDPSSQQQLARQQQEAMRQADQISQQLKDSQRAGELADQRMEQAAEAMQEALNQLGAEESEQAADQARQAADHLRNLAEHLNALNEPEFANRLARAGNLAQQLAEQQRELSKKAGQPSPAGKAGQQDPDSASPSTGSAAEPNAAENAGQQRRLVQRSEQLDELTARLAAESLNQEPEIQRLIRDAREANPTGEITELMRAAAEDFETERNNQALQSAQLAAESLDQLADDLRDVHEQLTQPDLEQLLAAEREAAELLRRMLDSRNDSERALARSKLEELEREVQPLAAGDQRISKARQALRRGNPSEETNGEGTPGSSNGMFREAGEVGDTGQARLEHSDQVMVDGLRQLTKVLQTKIQETILDRALQEPDDAVPPGYQKMVEEYYRALSEDLR